LKPTVSGKHALMLFVWFGYLGMKDLVAEWDDAYAAGYIHWNYYFAIGRLYVYRNL
jgi:hypothetical protein